MASSVLEFRALRLLRLVLLLCPGPPRQRSPRQVPKSSPPRQAGAQLAHGGSSLQSTTPEMQQWQTLFVHSSGKLAHEHRIGLF